MGVAMDPTLAEQNAILRAAVRRAMAVFDLLQDFDPRETAEARVIAARVSSEMTAALVEADDMRERGKS